MVQAQCPTSLPERLWRRGLHHAAAPALVKPKGQRQVADLCQLCSSAQCTGYGSRPEPATHPNHNGHNACHDGCGLPGRQLLRGHL